MINYGLFELNRRKILIIRSLNETYFYQEYYGKNKSIDEIWREIVPPGFVFHTQSDLRN